MCELNEQTRQTIPEINFLENVIALMRIIIVVVTLLVRFVYACVIFCRNKIDKDNHVTCKVTILITYEWVYHHRSSPLIYFLCFNEYEQITSINLVP
jgi:hypothetical protein